MARSTPRPREQALAIARRLRERFITPEVQQAARQAYNRLIETASAPDPEPEKPASKMMWGKAEGNTMGERIRQREGIELPPDTEEKPFSSDEKQKARAILELFRQRTGLKPDYDPN
jgi:hypothetical protein